MDGRDPRESSLVIKRAHVAPALELRTQLLREAVAFFVPLSLTICRHLGFHVCAPRPLPLARSGVAPVSAAIIVRCTALASIADGKSSPASTCTPNCSISPPN